MQNAQAKAPPTTQEQRQSANALNSLHAEGIKPADGEGESPPQEGWRGVPEGDFGKPSRRLEDAEPPHQANAPLGRSEPPPDGFLEMVRIWELHLPDNASISDPCAEKIKRKMRQRWERQFGSDAKRFEDYCRRVRGIAFLCGGGTRSWRASLDWATRPTSVARVLAGEFANGAKATEMLEADARMLAAKAIAPPETLTTAPERYLAEWRQMHAQILKDVGLDKWRSWFAGMQLIAIDDGLMEIEMPSRFVRDWVQQHFAELLPIAAEDCFGWDGEIVLQLRRAREEVELSPLAVAPKILAARG